MAIPALSPRSPSPLQESLPKTPAELQSVVAQSWDAAARREEALVQAQSTLSRFIENRFTGIPPIETSCCNVAMRRSTITGGLILVAYGAPAVVLISLKDTATVLGVDKHFTADPKFLGVAVPVAVGNLMTTVAFETNSTIDFVQKTMRPLSPEEERLLEDVIPRWKITAFVIGSLVFALFAQFPQAWGAYNASEPKLPSWVGLSMRQLQIAGPALSLFETFLAGNSLCRAPSYRGFELVLTNARGIFTEKLCFARNGLRQQTSERAGLLSKIRTLREQFAQKENVRAPLLEDPERGAPVSAMEAFEGVMTVPPIEQTSRRASGACSLFLDFFAYILLLPAFLADMVWASHEGAESLIGNDIALYSVAVMVGLISAKLFGSLIRNGLELPWESLHPGSHAPITKELGPKTYKFFTYTAPILSLAPIFDKLAGTSSFGVAALPFGIAGSVGAFFVGISSFYELRDGVIFKFSQNDSLAIADFEIEKIAEVIGRTKPRELALFLAELSQQQRRLWTELDVTNEQLHLYLQGPRRA